MSRIAKVSPSPGEMNGIQTVEVSLVGSPANKRRFLLTKSQEKHNMDELLRALAAHTASGESELVGRLQKSGASDDAISVAQAVLRAVDAYADELTPDVLAEVGKAIGVRFEANQDQPESITKTELELLPEPLRKRVEEVMGSNAELVRSYEEVQKRLDAQETEREVAKVADTLSELEGIALEDADEIAKSLYALRKNDSSAFDAILKALSSANEVAKNSDLFVEKGSRSEGATSGSANAELEEKAAEIAKSEGISLGKAMTKALDADADLRKRYAEEIAG